MVPSDIALQQLFHFQESGNTSFPTFDVGALMLFFVPYLGFATLVSGLLCPAGLFVPMLLAGATFGRVVGIIVKAAAGGYSTDSGTYALVGSAALLGGMSRMTMAGTIILLEASGNSEFLLPLMLTFAAARYSGTLLFFIQYSLFIDSSLRFSLVLSFHQISFVFIYVSNYLFI
ncbi:voltage gated chloride channel-domain-containing protein [Ochromonadaceae sp. CCMP2298]|nr:voltage gated chloride channel-domain-containing protein [Ochromonadaceae sp. CCMP2298]